MYTILKKLVLILGLIPLGLLAQGVRLPTPVNIIDRAGSPTLQFYSGSSTLRATISSGATAALGLKNGSGTRIVTIFQNGNTLLGSGTSDPGVRLEIDGDSIIKGIAYFYTSSGTLVGSIGATTANILDFRNSSNLTRMSLYDNGAPPIGGTGANLVAPSILAQSTVAGSPTIVAEERSGQTADLLTAIDSTFTTKYFNVAAGGALSASSLAGSGTSCLQTNNSGVISATGATCGITSVGSDKQIIYNDGGTLVGSNAFTWNKTTDILGIGIGTGGGGILIDRNASNTTAQIIFQVSGSSSSAGAWQIGPILGAFEIIEGVSGNDFYRVDQTGLTRISGTSSGTTYTLAVRDTAGAPGINFYRSTTTKSASISSGSTAALSVQDSGDTHRFTIFQNGDTQVGSTTDQGYLFYSNGTTGLNGAVSILTGNVTVSAGRIDVTSNDNSNATGNFTNNGSTSFGLTASGGATAVSLQNNNAGTKLMVFSSTAISEVPTFHIGHGSPESVVTAAIGSIFMRTNGGAGTVLYVKESGTGNTGWVGK